MILELNERLSTLREELRGRERLSNMLEAAEAKLREQVARRDSLTAELEKEELDVEQLQGQSLTSLFHALLGDKEIKLKKEREEFLRAKLRHDQCLHAVTALAGEIADLKERLDQLGDLDDRYQDALAEKEGLLLSAADATAGQILTLSEALADLRAAGKEVGEALAAGQELLEGLNGVVKSMDSAKSWGIWDMLGGGILATAAKHSKIDEAQAQMHQVQALLGRFQRELADVMVESVPAADITEFDTFADYFLDNLIMDWVVQSKIERSLNQIVGVRDRVREIVATLEAERRTLQLETEAKAQKRRQLIEGAFT